MESPLTKEIQKGVQAMIDDGELKEIFGEWGIADRTPAKATPAKATAPSARSTAPSSSSNAPAASSSAPSSN